MSRNSWGDFSTRNVVLPLKRSRHGGNNTATRNVCNTENTSLQWETYMIYEKIGDVEISHFEIIWDLCSIPITSQHFPIFQISFIIPFHVPNKNIPLPLILLLRNQKWKHPEEKKNIFNLLPPNHPPSTPQPTNQPSNLPPLPLSGSRSHPRHLGGGCVSVTCEGCESFGTSSSCTYPGVCWSTRSIVAIHAVGFFRKKCWWFVDSLLSHGVERERNGELNWNRWVWGKGERKRKRRKW